LDLSLGIGEEGDIDAQEWNELISPLPGSHILQTWQWGQIKVAYGWELIPQVWYNLNGAVTAAALVFQRTIKSGGFSLPLRILYVPRGPLMDWGDSDLFHQVLNDLEDLARRQRAIFIKIDPEVVIAEESFERLGENETKVGKATLENFKKRGWCFSKDQVQFRNTVFLDLNGSEEELLSRMKQKTRYNLRLAQKKGVTVRIGSSQDHDLLYRMYTETSIRDGFVIRPENYYRKVWEYFEDEGLAKIFIAEANGEAIAGLVLFHFNKKAWYLYGMSSQHHRDLMPNYLLQWQAMIYARSIGCQQYDLWGAPDTFNEDDPLWGVFRFKEGLGGKIIRTCGAWDFAPNLIYYRFYTSLVPRILDVLRLRRKKQILQER
jgi:peptidoglycan pentaglycine glycine transferase (the first glycine)